MRSRSLRCRVPGGQGMEVEQLFTESSPPQSTWLPDSPWRDPAWRWLRAQWLFETGAEPEFGIDDIWVRRARDFLVARRTTEVAPASGKNATQLDPAIIGAVAIASEPGSDRCALLEAFLLSAEPLDEVARRCNLTVDVVVAFHSLFFA